MANRRRARVLVFIHIPKTAGTTLRTVLSMNEPGARSRALGNVFKGGGGVSTSLIERLRGDDAPDLREARLLRGHIPLGVREYLPRWLPKGRRVQYFTFLREPTDRTLSHYFRILEYRSGYGLPPLEADATLDEMVAGGYIHDNLHTRMLSGIVEPFGEVTEEMLAQAKRNLRDELAFFGLTERFDESLVLARDRLGLRTILYRTSGRVNASRPRGREIPSDLREAAVRCNRYDIELYEYARDLFQRLPEHDELDFQVELAALRAARAGDQIELDDYPAPPGFDGDPEAWRLLLEARANLIRMQFELARRRAPRMKAVAMSAKGQKAQGEREGGKRRTRPKGERKRDRRHTGPRKPRKSRAAREQMTGTEDG